MKLNRAIAAIVLVSAFAAPVAAGTFEDAVDAYARGDYAKALRLIRPLANDGNATAQFNLGVMYLTGRACSRTIQPQHCGFGKLQSKATPTPNPISGPCIATAKAWRRTIPRRLCGFGRLQTNATPSPSFSSETNTHSEKACRKTIVRR